jgi:hypothetical protein
MPQAAAYDFADAFPQYLRPDAERAIAVLSGHLAFPREDTQSFFVVRVEQDEVRIPTRIYDHRMRVGQVWGAAAFEPFNTLICKAHLSDEQILMSCCLLSRHHNGFVREAALSKLIPASKPYMVPFVTALASEYVYEILVLIHRHLGALDPTTYGAFFRDNQAHFGVLRERMKSYWNVYYRWHDYTAFDGSFTRKWNDRYIGFDIFDAFDQMRKSSSKTFSQDS